MYIYPLKEIDGCLCTSFFTQLSNTTINVEKHQIIAFHSKSLDMSNQCISYINICSERKEMFYLTTHSTHFIYGYMASDIW